MAQRNRLLESTVNFVLESKAVDYISGIIWRWDTVDKFRLCQAYSLLTTSTKAPVRLELSNLQD